MKLVIKMEPIVIDYAPTAVWLDILSATGTAIFLAALISMVVLGMRSSNQGPEDRGQS